MNNFLTLTISYSAIVLPASVLMILAYCAMRLVRFERNVPRLIASDDIERLKKEASVNMYAQVVANVLLAGAIIAIIAAVIFVHWYFVFVVPPFVLILVWLSNRFVPVEERILSMPAANAELSRERERIANIWQNERFPNW